MSFRRSFYGLPSFYAVFHIKGPSFVRQAKEGPLLSAIDGVCYNQLDNTGFVRSKMVIRRFQETDAKEVSALIVRTLREVNIKDYSSEYIENIVSVMQPMNIVERAAGTHMYVVCNGDKIAGCGAIGPYWDKTDESSLFTIFVLPEYHGRGIGKKIIAALEEDEYFLRAKRIEIPASITATPFYLKMGYTFKNGICEPDEEGLLRLEKHRRRSPASGFSVS